MTSPVKDSYELKENFPEEKKSNTISLKEKKKLFFKLFNSYNDETVPEEIRLRQLISILKIKKFTDEEIKQWLLLALHKKDHIEDGSSFKSSKNGILSPREIKEDENVFNFLYLVFSLSLSLFI
jgi:hypothetical protein